MGHVQKLLILDATQSPAFADVGLVHNDFAAGLEELNDDIAAVPNLVVLSSTDLDQRSWTSPEWGTSAFGHFLSSRNLWTGLNHRIQPLLQGRFGTRCRPRGLCLILHPQKVVVQGGGRRLRVVRPALLLGGLLLLAKQPMALRPQPVIARRRYPEKGGAV